MAIAAKADRYQAYTIAKVGEDGKLTVGIKNPGTKYGSDWTGWSAIKVTYLEEDADEALTTVLDNMVARAETILAYAGEDYDNEPSLGPNFPQELRDQLEGLVSQAEEVEGVEDKAALVKSFSDLFQAIYEGKQAYVSLYDYADLLSSFENVNLDLVEKDEEAGVWYDTGETIFPFEQTDALYEASDAMLNGFFDGSYSTEEALNPKSLVEDPTALAAVEEIMPDQDADGYYLIGNRKQFAAYRAIASEFNKYAKGKLIADVDMAGVAMLPIGHNKGENAVHIFAGELDGQGHALTNVYIDDTRFTGMQEGDPATLFYELQNATVKNLKLTGEYYDRWGFTGGITRWMSGKSTIDNCEIAVAIHFDLDASRSGDASSGGVIGRNGSANSLISNCLVNCQLIGDADPVWYCGGVCGWADAALVVKNTLILNEYDNVGVEGDNSQTVSRGATPNLSNVFASQVFRNSQGTIVTAEQLASGEIAWKLNGSTGENPYWFQTLGTEPTPHLFDGDVVYYYGGEYMNDKPNPQLNAYAYALEANKAGSNVMVSFMLNAEAESALVRFNNGYTQAVEGELKAGIHRVTVPMSAIGSDLESVEYEVEVTGKGSLEVLKAGESYKVWGPYGMAVNNNPKSKNFGQVLLAESWVQDYVNGSNVYHTGNKVGALYAFDQKFQPVSAADGTPGFYGGLDIANETPLENVNGYCLDLQDLRFSDDGRLFVARAGAASNSSVWEIDPEDLDKPWTPVFTGGELDEATGITYVGDDEQNRMAYGLAFEGEGENLKMYVLGGQRSNGELNATDYNCAFYNLGTATEWSAAPSGYVEAIDTLVATPYQAGIFADGLGGLWFIQRATASATTAAIKHFDAEGNEDYSKTNVQYGGGRIAVTADGSYLAIPTGNGTIALYQTDYVPMSSGLIRLEAKQIIKVSESSIASLAFDWAGNLYVASGGTETFSRYTIPYENKVVVTPGNGIGDGIVGDVNSDGFVDGGDAQQILNVMAVNGYDTKCDVNKDGYVDGGDCQQVLNIMSAQ